MIRGWYPSANTKDHYVFLNTLAEDNPGLKAAAQTMITINPNLNEDPNASFQEGIEFLRAAAASERKKELAFLKSKDISISGDNVSELITEINGAKMEIKEFKRRVKEEKDRRNVKGTGAWSYSQGLSGYISSAKNQLSKQKNSKEMTTIAGVTRSALIKMFKSLGGKMTLEQLSAVIGAAQSFIMSELTEKMTDGDGNILPQFLNQKKGGTINQGEVEKLIKATPSYEKFIQAPVKNLSTLQEYANNVLSKYGYTLSKEARAAIKKAAGKDASGKVNLPRIVKDGADKGIDWANIMKNVQENRDYQKALENIDPKDRYVININGNTGMGGEARIYNDIQNALIKGWVGGSGGKIDVYEFATVSVNFQNTVKGMEDAIKSVENIITKETQSQFNKVGDQFAEYYQHLDTLLTEAGKSQDKLSKSFITHYNIKDYASTNDSSFSGFKGGDYVGLQIIEAISALNQAGFSSADIDWLTTCFVNTATDAIGASNKSSLEKYFSLFATMMLFDDGKTIAMNAAKNLAFESLQVLHIFPLNNIYVPASVVMTKVADQLEMFAMDEADAITVTINPGKVNFPEELNELSKKGVYNYHRWDAIKEKQISAMSAKIKFLANFSSIIDAIQL